MEIKKEIFKEEYKTDIKQKIEEWLEKEISDDYNSYGYIATIEIIKKEE